jgi:hypothetical protein
VDSELAKFGKTLILLLNGIAQWGKEAAKKIIELTR